MVNSATSRAAEKKGPAVLGRKCTAMWLVLGLTATLLLSYFLTHRWMLAFLLYPVVLVGLIAGSVLLSRRSYAPAVASILVPILAIGAVRLDVRSIRENARANSAEYAEAARFALAVGERRCGFAHEAVCDVTEEVLDRWNAIAATEVNVIIDPPDPPHVVFTFRPGSHIIVHYSPGFPFCFCEQVEPDLYYCGPLAERRLSLVEEDRCTRKKLRSLGYPPTPEPSR